MDRRQRIVTLGIAAVIAVVAVIVVLATTGGSDEKTATTPAPTPAVSTPAPGASATASPAPDADAEPPPIAIAVKDGKVVGGVTKIRVKKGDRITFTVTADVADEVHVHAYDYHKDIEAPGDTVKFDFKANITGITEAELEDAGLQIASIRVDP